MLHYGRRGEGLVLEAGLFFTTEPMLNAGARDIRHLPDGWTVVTKDRSLSAQWEHMVAVTGEGCEVLTELPQKLGSSGCRREARENEDSLPIPGSGSVVRHAGPVKISATECAGKIVLRAPSEKL